MALRRVLGGQGLETFEDGEGGLEVAFAKGDFRVGGERRPPQIGPLGGAVGRFREERPGIAGTDRSPAA